MKVLKKEAIIFGIIFISVISLVLAIPLIDYINSTPTNNTYTTNTSIEINISITESNLSEVKFNWNGTNYTIMNNSLVLMYNFDNISALGENDTYVIDVSGNENNGTVVGGSVTIANGKYGRAMQFDGVNDYVSTSNVVTTNQDNWTLSLWAKKESSPVGVDIASILLINGKDDANGYSIGLTSSDNITILYPVIAWQNSNYIMLNNTWTHITATRNSGTLYLYINGKLTQTLGTQTPNTPTSNVTIGTQFIASGSRDFNGSIDEVRIYNRSLSASEIQQQYFTNLNKFNSTQWHLYVNQSKNATNGLTDGTYTYYATATNSSGNENITEKRTLTVDTTTPNISITYPIDKAAYISNITAINYTSTETGSCWYSTDSGVSNSSLVTAGTSFTGLNSGTSNLTVYCNNSAGAVGQDNISFIIGDFDITNEVNKMLASDTQASDYFGYSVSISGDYAIVGAAYEATGGSSAGAAYIYKKNSTGQYEEVNKIMASDAQAGDYFGESVSLSGDYAIVGAYLEATGGSSAGAAYIFKKNSTGQYEEVNKIQASDAQASDLFGVSVSLSGDYAIVGAYQEATGGIDAGAAYIYKKNSTGQYEEVNKIMASDAQAGDYFGYSISISGDYAIVGAYGKDTGGGDGLLTLLGVSGGTDAGAAYIYKKNSTGQYEEVNKIQASDAQAGDYFGYSVAISGDYAIVGSYAEDTGATDAGASYIYKKNSTGQYEEVNKIQASDAQASDYFGISVSISGDYAVVGASSEDTGGSNAGATYSFQLSRLPDTTSPTWENNKTNLTSSTTTGKNVYFNITLNDTNPDKFIFSFYNGSAWENDTITSYTNGQEINITKTISINSGTINWTWYFNDTSGNKNQTDIWSITLTTDISTPAETVQTTTPSSGGRSYLIESLEKSSNLKLRTQIFSGKSILRKIKLNKGTDITEIELKAKNWLTGEISIIPYEEVPDFCSIDYNQDYVFYKALKINSTFNSSLISEARLRLEISKDWIYKNNISTIKAVKCNPYYKELEINYINETNESGIYDLYSKGFSTLAILGTLSLDKDTKEGKSEKIWNKKMREYSFSKIFLWIILITILIGIIILLVKHKIYLREKIHTKFFDFEFKFRIGKK